VVVAVASFLAGERIDVVETGTSLPALSDVDIVLHDTGQGQGWDFRLEDFVRDTGAKMVIYSRNLRREMIEKAIAGGSSGYLSEVLTGPAIVTALERDMAGETVVLAGDHESSVDGAVTGRGGRRDSPR
jgi:NarL family two-component system response regulator LiaR